MMDQVAIGARIKAARERVHLTQEKLAEIVDIIKTNLPENSGKPWTPELDQALCNMFDSGASAKELTDYFKRSRSGIAARLVRLGKIRHRADLK